MAFAIAPEPGEKVYYPSRRGVEVTSRRFTVPGRAYLIEHLTEAGFSIGTLQGGRRVKLWLLTTELPIVAALVAAGLTPVAVASIGGYCVFTTGLLWFGDRPTPLELWATYQDRLVLLFISSDYAEFNQVREALQRAMGPAGDDG
jgi:hypothetical protein